MSKIVIPDGVTGHTPDPDQWYGYFYDPYSDSSLSMINGGLDADNMDRFSDRSVPSAAIQKNAMTGADSVAGTANLDYFGGPDINGSGWYQGIGKPEAASTRGIPIPGASIQIYLPFKARVLLTWSLSFFNDSAAITKFSVIQLFVNGKAANRIMEGTTAPTSQDAQQRRVGRCVINSADTYLRDRYKGRYWCGHKWIGTANGETQYLEKGYHTVSLRVTAHQDIKQTRIRARSMKYIYFKYGE